MKIESLYSSHAVIRYNNRLLYTLEHEGLFGPLLPGGRFEQDDKKRFSGNFNSKETGADVSKDVLMRELKEELNPSNILLKRCLGFYPNVDIPTTDGKTYEVSIMYFWEVEVEPKKILDLRKRTETPLLLLNCAQANEKVLSETLKLILNLFYAYNHKKDWEELPQLSPF